MPKQFAPVPVLLGTFAAPFAFAQEEFDSDDEEMPKPAAEAIEAVQARVSVVSREVPC